MGGRPLTVVVGVPFRQMFRFPWNAQSKMKWAVAMKRRTTKGALWMPGVGARLCQDHFVTGKYLQNYPHAFVCYKKLHYKKKLHLDRHPQQGPAPRGLLPSLFTYNGEAVLMARKMEFCEMCNVD